MALTTILAIICIVIIACLALYAGILIKRIKLQTKQLAEQKIQQENEKSAATKARNDNICESIRFIAKATAQKQCNVSEAAIRLSVLLETLVVDQPLDIDNTYPAISALFEKVKDMPTLSQRKERPVKEIKMLDMRRQIFEAEHEDAIFKEAEKLSTFTL